VEWDGLEESSEGEFVSLEMMVMGVGGLEGFTGIPEGWPCWTIVFLLVASHKRM